MKSLLSRFGRLAALLVVPIAAGCGDSAALVGGDGQACYPNGTCNAGLTCVTNSKICVRPRRQRRARRRRAEVSRALTKSVTAQGMEILTSAGVESLKADAKGVVAVIKGKDGKAAERRFSHAIVAVGIAPNTENIGLEALGVKTTKGHIDTDPCAAPTSRAFGRSAMSPRRRGWPTRRATRASSPPRRSRRSSATRTSIRTRWTRTTSPAAPIAGPQIASVGLTEPGPRKPGYEVKVGKLPVHRQRQGDRAGEAEGFVKTVFDAKTGELLGAHMIGAEVTELIQGYTIGKTLELLEPSLSRTSSRIRPCQRDDARERARRLWAGDPHLRGSHHERGHAQQPHAVDRALGRTLASPCPSSSRRRSPARRRCSPKAFTASSIRPTSCCCCGAGGGEAAGRRTPSVRLRPRALFLELRGRRPGVRAGRGRVDLRRHHPHRRTRSRRSRR